MSNSAASLGIANPPDPLFGGRLVKSVPVATRQAACLLLETVSVTTAVILTIRFLARTSLSGTFWFLGPTVLVVAALVPGIVRKESFAEIGLSTKRIKQALPVLARTCLIVLPATFVGFWLLKLYGLEPPLRVVPPANGQLLSWLFYQFLYVAVAEEVFFRGYLQSNIARLTAIRRKAGPALQKWITIVLCAACFAAAHIIVHGQIVSVLTFFPGLILAYLFVRTRALLAPIIFHGLANTFYYLMAATLT